MVGGVRGEPFVLLQRVQLVQLVQLSQLLQLSRFAANDVTGGLVHRPCQSLLAGPPLKGPDSTIPRGPLMIRHTLLLHTGTLRAELGT